MTNLRTALRWLLALTMIGIGAMHFRATDAFASIVPGWLPAHRLLVQISGAAEIAGGAGLLVPDGPLRRAAAWGLIALYVAVFPANVNMALHDIPVDGRHLSPWLLWGRLPLQPLLVAYAWWYTRPDAAGGRG